MGFNAYPLKVKKPNARKENSSVQAPTLFCFSQRQSQRSLAYMINQMSLNLKLTPVMRKMQSMSMGREDPHSSLSFFCSSLEGQIPSSTPFASP